MPRILVVDDEPGVQESLRMLLKSEGDVTVAGSVDEALREVALATPDVVLLDLVMPGRSGLDLLQGFAERGVRAPVIVLTATNTVNAAVEAMKRGAADFVTKPFELDALRMKVRDKLEKRELEDEVERLRDEIEERQQLGAMVGRSEAMRDVFRTIERIAKAEATVLVTGESGTGKELVARAVHDLSPRADKPFVAVNCGAVAESLLEAELFGYEEGAFTGSRRGGRIGLIESAHHGTLFLDEIGEMPLPLQTRLLRVLEEREVLRVGSSRPVAVDVRVIAATHRPVEEMVEEGGFRRDLYYRLNVLRIALPGLARRRQDVAMLAEHFLQAGAQQAGEVMPELDASALALLEAHDWPGNVRELRNLMERLAVITRASGQLSIDAGLLQRHAPELTARPAPPRVTPGSARRPDRAQLQQALQRSAGDRAKLAAQFGISRTTLWRWLREAGLQ